MNNVIIYINYLIEEIYKISLILIPVMASVALIVWLDRRIWGFVQKRRGPNVVGPFGLLQTVADALKYILKAFDAEIQFASDFLMNAFYLYPYKKAYNDIS